MPQVTAFLIRDSQDTSRLFKLTEDEPVIIEYIMKNSITNETINNISTPTCFVCMLHLCNEKNLKINQNDDKTFFVDYDGNN